MQLNKQSEFLKAVLNINNVDIQTALRKYYGRHILRENKENEYFWKKYDERSEYLKKAITDNPNCSILEIGAGIGINSMYAASLGAKVDALEVKNYDVRILKKIQKELSFLKIIEPSHHVNTFEGDILNFNPEKKYDIILLRETFHHLEPRDQIVQKLKDLSVPGGVILFSESNAWNPLVQFFLFRVRGFEVIKKKVDPDTGLEYSYGNERILFPFQLKKIFDPEFDCVSLRLTRWLPSALSRYGKFSKLCDRLEDLDFFQRMVPFLYIHYEMVLQNKTTK